jgi:hypothetical protein
MEMNKDMKDLMTATVVYDGSGVFPGLVKFRKICAKMNVSKEMSDRTAISGFVAEMMAHAGGLPEFNPGVKDLYIDWCMKELQDAFNSISKMIDAEAAKKEAVAPTAPVAGDGFVFVNVGEDLGQFLDKFLGEMFGERPVKKEEK